MSRKKHPTTSIANRIDLAIARCSSVRDGISMGGSASLEKELWHAPFVRRQAMEFAGFNQNNGFCQTSAKPVLAGMKDTLPPDKGLEKYSAEASPKAAPATTSLA